MSTVVKEPANKLDQILGDLENQDRSMNPVLRMNELFGIQPIPIVYDCLYDSLKKGGDKNE